MGEEQREGKGKDGKGRGKKEKSRPRRNAWWMTAKAVSWPPHAHAHAFLMCPCTSRERQREKDAKCILRETGVLSGHTRVQRWARSSRKGQAVNAVASVGQLVFATITQLYNFSTKASTDKQQARLFSNKMLFTNTRQWAGFSTWVGVTNCWHSLEMGICPSAGWPVFTRCAQAWPFSHSEPALGVAILNGPNNDINESNIKLCCEMCWPLLRSPGGGEQAKSWACGAYMESLYQEDWGRGI